MAPFAIAELLLWLRQGSLCEAGTLEEKMLFWFCSLSLQLLLGAMLSYYSCLTLSSGTKKMVICVSTVTQAKNGKSKFPKPAPRYLTASDRLLTKAFNTLVKFPTRSDNRFYRFFTQRKLSCVFLPESSTKHFCNLVNIPGEIGKRAKPVCNFCGQLPAVKPLQTQKEASVLFSCPIEYFYPYLRPISYCK